MINKELIYKKIDELMHLTIECKFEKEDYEGLLAVINQRISHVDNISYGNQIWDLVKKIKEIEPEIEFIPLKVVVNKGFKTVDYTIRNKWHLENLSNNMYFKKIVDNKEIWKLYWSLLKLYADYYGWDKEEDSYSRFFTFPEFYDDCYNKEGKFLYGIDVKEITEWDDCLENHRLSVEL